jgi:glycosyltransferase involved in cell wall biosynthesis
MNKQIDLIKVSLLISNLAGGGAEGVCITIANELAIRGYDVTLVVLNENNITLKSKVDPIVNYKVLNVNRGRFSFFKLFFFLRKNADQIVFTFDSEVSIVSLFIKKYFFPSKTLVVRNINTFSSEFFGENTTIFRRTYGIIFLNLLKSANYIICQSEAMSSDFKHIFKKLNQKLIVIHNPKKQKVPTNNIEIDDLDSEKYILSIGRLENSKSVEYIISSFSVIAKKYPNLKLYVVGEGSEKSKLINQVASLGLTHRVKFFGFVEHPELLYKNAQFTALTSQYEGLPNVLIESISFGTPVLSFNCPGGIHEIIIPRLNGLITPLNDIESLSEGIIYMLENYWDRSKIIDSSKKFDIDAIVDEYIKIINNS